MIAAMKMQDISLTEEEREALHAYSNGDIGWREACRLLPVVDHGELAALLVVHGLQPPVDETPLDPATAARFGKILKGGADGW
jgi:hypothetical protein